MVGKNIRRIVRSPRCGSGILAVALSIAILNTGCTARVHSRGHVIDPVAVSEIAVGTHGKRDVADILGTPSTIGTFDQDVWYYISEQTEKLAFFEPRVMARRILAVHYDRSGVVQDITQYDLEDAKSVAIVDRETPTAGNDTTVLQELFGDIGRFASPPSRSRARGAP